MFIHDCIKMKYSDSGYLPGYPYYLISDAEMFDAFTKESGFFDSYYPCPCDGNCPCTSPCNYEVSTSVFDAYNTFRQYLFNLISDYQSKQLDVLPDWVYAYMLGNCITYESDELDLYYLNDLLGFDTTKRLPEFSIATANACLQVSTMWLNKQPTKINRRPPTIFGEPHVIKSLRLDQANILL